VVLIACDYCTNDLSIYFFDFILPDFSRYVFFKEKSRFNSFFIGQQLIIYNANAINPIVSISPLKDIPKCNISTNGKWMNYICPVNSSIDDLDIDDVNSTILESIETLWVRSFTNAKGPLTRLPSNVCRFTILKV
jgi:hypothetical protein